MRWARRSDEDGTLACLVPSFQTSRCHLSTWKLTDLAQSSSSRASESIFVPMNGKRQISLLSQGFTYSIPIKTGRMLSPYLD